MISRRSLMGAAAPRRDAGAEAVAPYERVDQWRAVLAGLKGLPVMLRAAIAWDSWLRIEPLHAGAWRSTLMAAAIMREGGLTQHHLMPIAAGGRRSRYRDGDHFTFEQRSAGFLDWVTLTGHP